MDTDDQNNNYVKYSGGQMTVIFLAIKPTTVSGIVLKDKKYVFSQLKQIKEFYE